MKTFARRAAVFEAVIFVAMSSSPPAQALDSSGAAVRGEQGEPVARAVVRWRDMERLSAESRPALRAYEAERPRPISQDLPVPEGAIVKMEARADVAVPPSATLPSPALAASFEALPNGSVEPPDTHGAAGPNHLMVTLNSSIRIQDRSGNPLSTVPLWAFWQRLSPGGDLEVYDPRVVYDPYADRWITTAVGSYGLALLVGVSQDGDPTGSWNLYMMDSDLPVDIPNTGFNKNWIVVTSSTNYSTTGTRIWVFGKADLYAGGKGSFRSFSGKIVPMGPVPAVTLDPEVSALYLVSNWNGNDSGNGVLRLYSITGPIGSEVLTPVAFAATPNPWADYGPDCPQKGDPRGISCFGYTEVVFRNGTIWATHAIFLPAVMPTRAGIQWWQLAPDGEIIQRGRLEDALGVASYAFPSLAVNARGDMLLGFASFSAQHFASGGYAYRAANDPPGSLREERLLKAGEDSYFRDQDGFATNRWGDYSATVVDPINDTDFWTIQEYAAPRDPVTGQYRWGTWWGRVPFEVVERMPPQPPAPVRTPRALPLRGSTGRSTGTHS